MLNHCIYTKKKHFHKLAIGFCPKDKKKYVFLFVFVKFHGIHMSLNSMMNLGFFKPPYSTSTRVSQPARPAKASATGRATPPAQ